MTTTKRITALFFNRFLNEIFVNLKHLEGEDTSFDFKPPKNSKNVYFLLHNRNLKPKIDCENNGKWKLQTCFSRNYDFAFTNLLNNAADKWQSILTRQWLGEKISNWEIKLTLWFPFFHTNFLLVGCSTTKKLIRPS
jgi:hypothetical protein